MRYLATYKLFESDEVDYNGLTKEDVEDMFIEVSDMGFQINILFDKRIVMINKDGSDNLRVNYATIPLITVKMSLPIKFPANMGGADRFQIENQKAENEDRLRKFKVSDEFHSIIGEVNDRISHNGWYIFDSSMIKSGISQTLKVFLQRKQDSKYDK